MAAARRAGCVLAEVRGRWTLNVLQVGAWRERKGGAEPCHNKRVVELLLLGRSKQRSPNLKGVGPQEINGQHDTVEIEFATVAMPAIDDLLECGRQADGISVADFPTRTVNAMDHAIRGTHSS